MHIISRFAPTSRRPKNAFFGFAGRLSFAGNRQAFSPGTGLTLVALLVLAACQTHRPQENAPSPSAAQSPSAPPTGPAPAASVPAAPSPAPFRPVPPEPTPTPSRTAPASAAPSPPSQQKPASNAATTPPKASTPTSAPDPKSAAAAPATASPAAPKPASLDLNSLEQRLKDTRAIGVFTKLSLKNQVDDLLGELREFHKGSSKLAQPLLRQKYDLLIMKVLSLLQAGDPPLASAIASSREAIWQILMDPSKFAKI
jgi:hypothetical protein